MAVDWLTRFAPLATLLSALLGCLPATVDFYILQLRGEPFLPWDLMQVSEAAGVASAAGIHVQKSMVVSGVVVLALTVGSFFLYRGRQKLPWVQRLAGFAASTAATCALIFGVFLQPAVTQSLGILPDAAGWRFFADRALLAAGMLLILAGIVFFFAYNWDELPKFAKLGIVEVLLIASVLLATFTRWNKLVKQILLTGATFLIGTLFAVFGQIYQTGADAYDLFLGWTLFTILWAVAIRFAPLWLTFIGLQIGRASCRERVSSPV